MSHASGLPKTTPHASVLVTEKLPELAAQLEPLGWEKPKVIGLLGSSILRKL